MKIGVWAHGPGSVNTITPLLKKLNQHELFYFPFHDFAATEWGSSVQYDPNNPPYDLLIDNKIEVVIFGTGSCHKVETEVAEFCEENGIISISILDIFWGSKENLKMRYESSPDYIITPNQKSADACKGLFPRPVVLPLGNPHFDRLFEFEKQKDERTGGPYTVAFISSPSDSSSSSETSLEAQKMLFWLLEYPDLVSQLTFFPHPRENLLFIEHVIERYANVEIKKGVNTLQEALKSDMVAGVNSTVLYESLIIGKPTLLYSENLIVGEEDVVHDFVVEPGAAERIVKFIDDLNSSR